MKVKNSQKKTNWLLQARICWNLQCSILLCRCYPFVHSSFFDVYTTHMNWKLHGPLYNVTEEEKHFPQTKVALWYWLPFQINEAVLSLRLVYSAWTSFSFFLKLMRWFMLFLIFSIAEKMQTEKLRMEKLLPPPEFPFIFSW